MTSESLFGDRNGFEDCQQQARDFIERKGTQALVDELRAAVGEKRRIRLGTPNTLILLAHIDRLEKALREIELWPFDVGHTPERDLREIKERAGRVLRGEDCDPLPAGANDRDSDWVSFRQWLDKALREGRGEYRFMGSLGFGGKFWVTRNGFHVSCYPEDVTPERETVIRETNLALTRLLERTYA